MNSLFFFVIPAKNAWIKKPYMKQSSEMRL